jgi:glycogen synthase
LLFGQAVVQSLTAIAQDATQMIESVEWQLVMQDWQAAIAALAFASQDGHRGTLHLTLHNSYDEYSPHSELDQSEDTLKRPGLFRVGIDPDRCPGVTILDRAMSLARWPVFTVSDEFAKEFTDDLLQREIMAKHLQEKLKDHRILGIDNGPFTDLAVPREGVKHAAAGAFASLQQWKSDQKAKALEELAKGLPDSVTALGGTEKFRRDDSPWIVMAGRDDPRQKGYDVAAAAAEDYLLKWHGKPGCAQFLFFPMLGDEGESGLKFLEELADRFPGDVLSFIGFWPAGFGAVRQGSAYGLMPSLYEPFGMANEFYLQGGCVGIGRATGGNLEQIVPLRATAAYSHAVRIRANRYHPLTAKPTGILVRERDDIPSAIADWNGINDAGYTSQGLSRVAQRRQYRVFQAMADELRIGIEDGLRVYIEEPELYYQMLATGIAHIQRTFSWHRAAQEYVRYVGQAFAS